jgi:carbamoyl-phosphate synthase large subunit
MTDPEFADQTYVEPLTVEFLERIIAKERPECILPTLGGQTALNLAIALDEAGILKKYNTELIGASIEAIKTAEDRELFRRAMDEIGLESARSFLCRSVEEGKRACEAIGLPIILRPSRTLGGTGGGIITKKEEIEEKLHHALTESPNSEVLVEESLLGWKEFELEVMRDKKDNVVIICGIENLDPMGVHTGDSITVAPIQTLTDKEYQLLRDAAIKVIRRIGVDTGGSNVQFALDPKTGRIIVIEMNPRVSRSSALASKATGFPIAKIAAKLAVGYTLDEIPNDITKKTPSCFEPSIDYVVVKIPRFNFEKFPSASSTLGTQMKSVGESMAFGRTFAEALQKAMASLETGSSGFDIKCEDPKNEIGRPSPERLWYVGEAFRSGMSISEVYNLSKIDPWFLAEIKALIDTEESLKSKSLSDFDSNSFRHLKDQGFTDKRLAALLKVSEKEVRDFRKKLGVLPSYKAVDTCAAEFESKTPYLYSCYDAGSEQVPTSKEKVIILGSGPNRIGQGIEFDYCCVHAVFAMKELGFEGIMVNCNPETVSTDYDISDRLYFEPLTVESVLSIVDREKPKGVIVQFGGQTPLKIARALAEEGVPILGTSVDSIDAAEDRKQFNETISRLNLKQPDGGVATSLDDALVVSERLGFPLMIRPSFVLGGRAMRILYSKEELLQYFKEGISVSDSRPVLLDKFLENAIEVDVDAVRDGENTVIAGVMEHIERAGIHSGDSSCVLPPVSLSDSVVEELKSSAMKIADALNVVGLLNVQFAVTPKNEVFVIEANPRASRTVPFVSKATGKPWAKIAAKAMLGRKITEKVEPLNYYSVKACVFPFNKFAGVDIILGPEMRSTGEVMGIDSDFAGAFERAQVSAGIKLPKKGRAFLSVVERDKADLVPLAKKLMQLGFSLCATSGTAKFLSDNGVSVEVVRKVREGSPHVVDMIRQGDIQLVINTPEGYSPQLDSRSIRLSASECKVPTYTTMAAAHALVQALSVQGRNKSVCSLQNYHSN